MTDRNAEYFLIQNRKPKKTKQYFYKEEDNDDDDDDDNDNNSQIYARLVRVKPQKEQRIRYVSSEEIHSGNRRRSSDSKIRIRKTANGDRVILDEDDNIIKVVRNERTSTPSPVEHRRFKSRPRESQKFFYETSEGHLASRPSKKNILQTKKTQVDYADDEPIKVIKKVIIDPRTGERETIYENDKPKKQQKYYFRQRPSELLIDSDDEDEQPQMQYVKLIKQRAIPREILPKHEPSTKYLMIKKKADSEPIYALTSRMPAIKTSRRMVYETPTKKSLTTYVYSTDRKHYK